MGYCGLLILLFSKRFSWNLLWMLIFIQLSSFHNKTHCFNITEKDFDSVHAHRRKRHLGNYRSLLGKTSPLEKWVKQFKHSLISRTKYFDVNSQYIYTYNIYNIYTTNFFLMLRCILIIQITKHNYSIRSLGAYSMKSELLHIKSKPF